MDYLLSRCVTMIIIVFKAGGTFHMRVLLRINPLVLVVNQQNQIAAAAH